jgi:hypothetical protein
MAGMRRNQTIVEEDGFWIRGHDGAHELVSVALGRDWVSENLRSVDEEMHLTRGLGEPQ